MHRSVKTGAGRQEYELVQTTRRDVAFRVLPGGKLRVYAPRSLPLREADRLVAANWAQIEQALRQMQMPELDWFMDHCMDPFRRDLDELQ